MAPHELRATRLLLGLDARAETMLPPMGTMDTLVARLWLIEAGHADPHVAEVRAALARWFDGMTGEDLSRARAFNPFAILLRRLGHEVG